MRSRTYINIDRNQGIIMKASDFENKKILVFGWARSGKAAAQRLYELGAKVTVVNRDDFEKDKDYLSLEKNGVVFINHDAADIVDDSFQYIVKNPGINYQHPIIKQAEKLNIPIITEVTVALSTFEGRLIGVTGSNGKTTTVSLIRDMLQADGQSVVTAGNIGTPVCEVAGQLRKDDTLLLELSSFQLLGTPDIQPDIAAVTNIFASHLNYHGSRENYVKAKFQITKHQLATQHLVLNADIADSQRFAQDTQAAVTMFSRQQSGYYAGADQDNLLVDNQIVMPLDNIKLVGPHNLENILAAVSVAKLAGVKIESMRQVLSQFGGVKYRLEFVFSHNGIKFYDDSKATDIEATQQALNSFDVPTVWLAGGLDRGDDLTRMKDNLKHVKSVIAFGETADKVVSLAKIAGIQNITVTENVMTAAPIAIAQAKAGDVVLLSPAAASWDQYRSFEERGDLFVKALEATLNI